MVFTTMVKKWMFIFVVALFSVALRAGEADSYGIEFDPDEAFGATMEEMKGDGQPSAPPPAAPPSDPLASQEGLPVYNNSPQDRGGRQAEMPSNPSYSPTHWGNYPSPYVYPYPDVYPYPATGGVCRTSGWSYCYMRGGWGYPLGSPCTCTVRRVNALGFLVWYNVPGVITRW